MRIKEFKKIIQEKEPEQIIGLHTHWKIKLTDRQINKVIDLKNKKYGIRREIVND